METNDSVVIVVFAVTVIIAVIVAMAVIAAVAAILAIALSTRCRVRGDHVLLLRTAVTRCIAMLAGTTMRPLAMGVVRMRSRNGLPMHRATVVH